MRVANPTRVITPDAGTRHQRMGSTRAATNPSVRKMLWLALSEAASRLSRSTRVIPSAATTDVRRRDERSR